MKTFRLFVVVAMLATLLVSCSNAGGSGNRPLQINGLWGGVLSYAGGDFAVFAMDVTTSVSGSSGTISGYGLMTDGSLDVPLAITGTTRQGEVALVMTDAYNSRIYLSGESAGQLVRGNWSFPNGSVNGTFRMSYEDNIHLLSSAQSMSTATGRLTDLAAVRGVH